MSNYKRKLNRQSNLLYNNDAPLILNDTRGFVQNSRTSNSVFWSRKQKGGQASHERWPNSPRGISKFKKQKARWSSFQAFSSVNHISSTIKESVDLTVDDQDNDCINTSASVQSISIQSSYKEACSKEIWEYFVKNRQSNLTYRRKQQLCDALLLVVRTAFPQANLFMVGSSMNGFGSDKSDLDLCLTVTSHNIDQKKESPLLLSQLMTALRRLSFITSILLIRAKVSILKFRDVTHDIECDLNVNSVTGIYNTHLLGLYARTDWRLRPLAIMVKHWAACLGIHDASQGRLSSYSILLMVIHFLQAGVSPPVLPVLQKCFPLAFTNNRAPFRMNMQMSLPLEELASTNPLSLFDLFHSFVEYYAEKFNYNEHAISVRLGKCVPINDVLAQLPNHEQLNALRGAKIFIEEPFTLLNTAHSLYDEGIFARVKRAFRVTLKSLQECEDLQKILNTPV